MNPLVDPTAEEPVKGAYNSRSRKRPASFVGKPGKRRRKNNYGETHSSGKTWAVRHFLNLLKRMQYERYLRPGCSMVDLCCGQGGDLNKAAYQKVSSYIGVDFSTEALEEARFRARTTPVVKKSITEVMFIEQDLRDSILQINPAVDVVSCQLALHYIWSSAKHIDTFLTSVRDSLRVGGYFLVTIVDSENIPAQGILNHPYIKLSAPRDGSYQFTFPGLVNDLKEYVVQADELKAKCAAFSLKFLDSCKIRDVYDKLLSMHPTKPPLTNDDWLVLDLYKSFAFVKE